jgi:thiol-disulfide isomerase/thioredoxin
MTGRPLTRTLTPREVTDSVETSKDRLRRGFTVLSRAWLCGFGVSLTVGLAGCGGAEEGGQCEPITAAPRNAYVAAPYGVEVGQTLGNLSFIKPDGSGLDLQSVRADGTRRLLLLTTAAGWCKSCIDEQPALQRLYEDYSKCGLELVVAVFEDDRYEPATADLAGDWASDYDVTFPVVADPGKVTHAYYDSNSTPMLMFVDLDTMAILSITTGVDSVRTEAFVANFFAGP